MDIVAGLIPVSLLMGLVGLLGFWWTLKRGQYDDPEGDGQRILRPDYDDRPKS